MTRKSKEKNQRINIPPESEECQLEIRRRSRGHSRLEIPLGSATLKHYAP